MRLVVLLYEQALEDMRRALAAQQTGDVEARTNAINHAVLVIGHLQTSLDKNRGGKVAANLDRFYNQVRAGLIEAQSHQSAPALERQILHLMQTHGAWCEVELAERNHPDVGRGQAASTTAPEPSASLSETEAHSSAEWNA